MFRTIVLAILFVELVIPFVCGIFAVIFGQEGNGGCGCLLLIIITIILLCLFL